MCYRYCGEGEPPRGPWIPRDGICSCSGEDPLYTAQQAERDRNAAAVRVRARRRIRRALGDIQVPGDLAPVLKLVIELEKRDKKLMAELAAVVESFRGENI